MRDENGGSCQVCLLRGQLDLDGSPGCVDLIGHRQRGLILILDPSRRGGRYCSGATGAGFADSAFINAHRDVLWAKPPYELQICALRKLLWWIPSRCCMKWKLVQVVREAHRVGIAH